MKNNNEELTPRELKRAQRIYYLFNLFNVISFNFLSGNIITLYALRLGLTNFLIGVLASFVPLAQLMPLVGRMLVSRFGIVKLFGTFWFIRYLLMVPILFSPIFAAQGNMGATLALCIISILGFNLARGIGMTSHNPIIGTITTEKERGSFLSKSQLIIHSGAIVTGLFISLLLGQEPPLFMYTIVILIGIASGIGATIMVFKLPEPAETGKAVEIKLVRHLIEAFRRPAFSRFMLFLAFSFFTIAMVQPFLIVFMKNVYGQGDDTVILFTVIGSVGAIVMALISGFMIDKLGAKPLIFIFASILTVMLLALVVAPGVQDNTALWMYGGAVFFLFMMGHAGIANASNTYFFGLIGAEERLNLGIFYFLTTGIAGFLGSLFGGAVLEAFQQAGLSQVDGFRSYFAITVCLFIVILYLTSRLERLGSYPIRDVLTIFLSPRDLRALRLLNRLGKSTQQEEEQSVIQALGESQSGITADELLLRLKSPRFDIRAEALSALTNLPLDERISKALVSEVKNHRFTTAYLAADMIGKKNIPEGVKALRQSIHSRDYFLIGKAMVALARLNDLESIATIRDILEKTDNPRLIIHAAHALEIFSDLKAIPILIGKLEKKRAAFLRDEVILSISGILGFGTQFYPLYIMFLESSSRGVSGLKDLMSEEIGKGNRPVIPSEELGELLDEMLRNREKFAQRAADSLRKQKIKIDGINLSDEFERAVRNEKINKLERFCFLTAAMIVWFSFIRR